jgi:hypothetical protein
LELMPEAAAGEAACTASWVLPRFQCYHSLPSLPMLLMLHLQHKSCANISVVIDSTNYSTPHWDLSSSSSISKSGAQHLVKNTINTKPNTLYSL